MIAYPARTSSLYCVIYNAILLATELRRVKPSMVITRNPPKTGNLFYELDEGDDATRLNRYARRWRHHENTGSSDL